MKKFSILVACVALALVATKSFAEDPQINGKKHPRRKQVVDRAQNEKTKNDTAAGDGQITQAQAQKLNRRDNRIERREQADAAKNGGHITKAEQARLNKSENSVNRERQGMENKDAAGSSAPAGPAGQ